MQGLMTIGMAAWIGVGASAEVALIEAPAEQWIRKPAKTITVDGRLDVIAHDHKGRLRHRALVGGNQLHYRGKDETDRARQLPVEPLPMPASLAK